MKSSPWQSTRRGREVLPTLGSWVILLLLGIFWSILLGRLAQGGEKAIANPAPPSCESLLPQAILAQQSLFQDRAKAVKENAIRAEYFPPPSLWWAKEQFDPFAGRLIEDWKVQVNLQLIDLQVNRQLWSTLDYVNRYQFVSKFGTIARESHYNLRIVNAQNKCLAVYYCRFDTIPNQCDLQIETSERPGLRIDLPLIDGVN